MRPCYPSETFHVLKTKELRQFGKYRTYRTQCLVLEASDRLLGEEGSRFTARSLNAFLMQMIQRIVYLPKASTMLRRCDGFTPILLESPPTSQNCRGKINYPIQ